MCLPDTHSPQQELTLVAERLEQLTDTLLESDAGGTVDDLSVQRLFDAAVRLFEQRHARGLRQPFPPGSAPTATAVAISASAMLSAAELEVFELGMWQAWSGGRRDARP
jgi:hypothetical protein